MSWGGRRPGAGRKPVGVRAGVAHGTRAELTGREPLHVTLRLGRGLPNLRRVRTSERVLQAFHAANGRFGTWLVHFSVQSNHVHLIVEAEDRQALTRGMQGLQIRLARGLNRLWGRRGTVFADRYHVQVLIGPRVVRNALAYVLLNGRRHGSWRGAGVDPFSSGPWFDGWREDLGGVEPTPVDPVVPPQGWLLRVGWRRSGLISVEEVPGAAPRSGARGRCGARAP